MMDTHDYGIRIDRRMFAAAAAAWTGAATGWLQASRGLAAAADSPAKPGPPSPWPQTTASTPYLNAADFGLRPCRPDKMKIEVFAENPDATEALQKALDAGAGGHVFIPPGAYRVTRPLVVQSGTSVMGSGYCSTVLSTEKPLPGVLHLKKVGGPMTVVSDLFLGGPVGGNRGANGIWLDNSNGVTVHDCWISAWGTGIRVDGISDTWLRHLVCELNYVGISAETAELGWASGNLRLLDCYGYQNQRAAITLSNCRSVQAHSCAATGSAHAILARRCAQMTIQGAQVNFDGAPWHHFGVRLEDCEHATLTGSVVEGMIDYGIALVGCRHVTATGNVVRNTSGGPGFLVENCAAGVIAANSISQSAEDGMRVSGCRHLAITGNVIDSYGQSKQRNAVWHGLRIDNCRGCQEQANIVVSE
jgi:hypothetical protein